MYTRYTTLMAGKITGREFTRRKVRERDDYTCQDCGFKRTLDEVREKNKHLGTGVVKGKIKSLDVHHINGMCGKNSRGYDSVKAISGLVTLCHSCHYKRPEHETHSKRFKAQRSFHAKRRYLTEISAMVS